MSVAVAFDIGAPGVVEVAAGPIGYHDTGGSGPVLVLVHGLIMDGRLWREVIDILRPAYRRLPRRPRSPRRDAVPQRLEWGQVMIADDLMDRASPRSPASTDQCSSRGPLTAGTRSPVAGAAQ